MKQKIESLQIIPLEEKIAPVTFFAPSYFYDTPVSPLWGRVLAAVETYTGQPYLPMEIIYNHNYTPSAYSNSYYSAFWAY